jgi:Pyridoxamine 5'-phosphate oxidase
MTMNIQKEAHKSFSQSDIKSFEPEMKVGLLATVNEDGLPHITLLSSLCASSPTELVFGQFSEGLSKFNVRRNPKVGFLILTLDRNIWRGRANFTHTARSGREFDYFNNQPMFRYNSYFGIHTVYYFKLEEQYGKQPLPMGSIIQAAIKTLIAKAFSGNKGKAKVLNPWTRQLIDKISNLKFLAYVAEDGHPVIIPIIQAQTSDTENIIFAASVFKEEIRAIPSGTTVSLFCMSFDMEDVLLRGKYLGIKRIGGVQCGKISIRWVYSPMPPKPQQIYPEIELEALTNF